MSSQDGNQGLENAGFTQIRLLYGEEFRGLYEAHEGGARCLVTVTATQTDRLVDVRQRLGFETAGVLPLRDVRSLDPERSLLVEALVEGTPVSQRGRLGPVELSSVYGAVGASLGSLHAKQVFVGALQPEVVYVTGAAGEARLSAFGPRQRAFVEGARSISIGLAALFPDSYSAPEAVSARASEATDVFTLAACVVQAATGMHPFAGDDLRARVVAAYRGERSSGRVEGRLGDVLDRCLAREPASRPRLGELLDALAVHGRS